MCFPQALPLAAAGIQAGGSIFGGFQQAAASKAQAQALDNQAKMTWQQGEYQAGQVVDKENQTIGDQIAGVAGSGVNLEGSPTNVIGSSASDAALDIGAIKWGARANSNMLKFQAGQTRAQAPGQIAGGFLGAAGALAKGAADTDFTKLGTSFGYRPKL